MKIQSLPPPLTLSTARPAPQPEKTPDRFERTAFGEALDSLPKYARGAAVGLGTVTPPLLGGMGLGWAGALAGGAVAFGFQYAQDKDAGRAAGAAAWPTLLGVLASTSQAAPTALRLAGAAGIGLAAGVLSVLRQDSMREQGPVRSINEPGQKVDLEKELVPGKTNVVVFSADWCPACQLIEPGLEKYVEEKSGDHVLLKVDIQNWKSPVSQQYGLKSIPHFKIFDGQGKLLSEGDAARAVVDGWVTPEPPSAA